MSVFDNLGSIAKVVKQIGNIDLYKQILDVQADSLKLMEENKRLRKENYKLKEKLKLKEVLIFEKDLFWMKNKKGDIIEGPFCPRCHDAKKLLMHLVQAGDYKKCPGCKYATRNY